MPRTFLSFSLEVTNKFLDGIAFNPSGAIPDGRICFKIGLDKSVASYTPTASALSAPTKMYRVPSKVPTVTDSGSTPFLPALLSGQNPASASAVSKVAPDSYTTVPSLFQIVHPREPPLLWFPYILSICSLLRLQLQNDHYRSIQQRQAPCGKCDYQQDCIHHLS